MDEVKLSVIIPVYNCADYLEECLDSVLSQSIDQLEVLCVDNNSTDGSLEILKARARVDSRIHILVERQPGAGHARNNGIRHARGEFIAFLDGDDRYPDSEVLELLYRLAINNDAVICGGELLSFDSTSGETNNVFGYSEYNMPSIGRFMDYREFQDPYYYQRYIYNRDYICHNKLFFPGYLRFQDPVFFVSAMTTAKKFFAIPRVTYCYRSEHKSIEWNDQKAMDMVRGISDIVLISTAEQLEKLQVFALNLFELEWWCCKPILDTLRNGNLTMLSLMIQAKNNFSIDLLIAGGYVPNEQNIFSYLSSFIEENSSIFNRDLVLHEISLSLPEILSDFKEWWDILCDSTDANSSEYELSH